MKKCFSLLIFFLISGCKLSNDAPITFTTYSVSPGDIVISNSGNRSVLLLDSNGNYKSTLLDLTQSENPIGLAWKDDTKEILIVIDSTADRIVGVSALNGTRVDFINDIGNLTGNLYGITQLSGGDVLIAETNAIERYSSSGVRITAGGWPLTLMNGSRGLFAYGNNNQFILTSDNVDRARAYSNTGALITDSGISNVTTTTDIFSAIKLSDGRFALVWNGTTDTIQVRATLNGPAVASYSNASILSNPRAVAEASNGNLLVVDATSNLIVEITTAGQLVRTIGGGVTVAPNDILVIPDFY